MSVHMNSLLCLLGEAHRGEELGIPSHILGCHFLQSGFFWVLIRFRIVCLLGSTADTVHVSVFGGHWLLFLIPRPLVSDSYLSVLVSPEEKRCADFLGDNCPGFFSYSALLGSTVATCSCHFPEA